MGMKSFDLNDDIEAQVEAEFGYGEKKKDFYNEAVRMWVQRTPLLDELFERGEQDKRVMFVEQAVREKIDEIKEQQNGEWSYSGPGECDF